MYFSQIYNGFLNRCLKSYFVAECGQFEFTCGSGECIAIYDVCNEIVQCEDGSDESKCPTSNNNNTIRGDDKVHLVQHSFF